MFKKTKRIIKSVQEILPNLEQLRLAAGRIEMRQLENKVFENIQDSEFQVFSQWGEDGIIQYLLRHVEIQNKVFVEFGVDTYLESNTRFLLTNNNWSGLVLDGSQENISLLKSDPIYWQYNLKADSAFITKDNINDLLKRNGIAGDIGLLSVDIDGNDYWVWNEIDTISPRIVVIEYNSRFGRDKAVTIPYNEKFSRWKAHYSTIYFGASLRALVNLGKKKGYSFIGCNSNGINAFFVRSDVLNLPLQETTVEAGYVAGKFREARDEHGQLSFISQEEEKKILEKLPLVELAD